MNEAPKHIDALRRIAGRECMDAANCIQALAAHLEKAETRIATHKAEIERLQEILRGIENTPPKNLIAVEGKNEHWWYRLVADMLKQAQEGLNNDHA